MQEKGVKTCVYHHQTVNQNLYDALSHRVEGTDTKQSPLWLVVHFDAYG
jgi:hypothetical protein